MATTADIIDPKGYFLERFAETFGHRNDPLDAMRHGAIDRFSTVGFPTVKEERWQYTNVEPLLRHSYHMGSVGSSDRLDAQRLIDDSILSSLDATRVVLVNGRYTPELSVGLDRLPQGVTLRNLSDAVREDVHGVRTHLGTHLFAQADNGFAALNAALHRDGIYLHVAKGTTVEMLIHIVHVSVAGKVPCASLPRTLIVAESGASASVVEHFVGANDQTYLTNAVAEVFCGDNARVEYYKIQEEGLDSFHVATVSAWLGRDSRFAAHNVSFGGKLVRNDFNARLDGEGGDATLNGLFVVDGERHVDNHMWMEHAAPHCESHQLYKGVLNDRAHGVFNGRIYVHRVAQKTDAYQASRNILLSDAATIDTNPELEIYADDVRCTHGATVGQIDPDAMMYLRARGIGKEEARNLLVFAFANEVTGQFGSAAVAERVSAALYDRLPHGAGEDVPA